MTIGPRNQILFMLSSPTFFISPNCGIETATSGQLSSEQGHSLHYTLPSQLMESEFIIFTLTEQGPNSRGQAGQTVTEGKQATG